MHNRKQNVLLRKIPKYLLPIFCLVLLVGVGVFAYLQKDQWQGDLNITEHVLSYPTPAIRETNTQGNPTGTYITQTWPIELTTEQAASITVVVNKKHKLPNDYVPAGLTPIDGGYLKLAAAEAMQTLINDAANNGFNLYLASDYRSYAVQSTLYNNYVAVDGQAQADTYSARPGFSEHQTGLTADIADRNSGCIIMTCFGTTKAGQWIASNAANYGFIIRYPEGKESITGYQYEPWHLRYVGISAAKGIVKSGLTMDEYFGMTAGGY